MALARAAYSLIAPGGPRARLSILIFHRVLAAPDPLLPSEPDARRFEALMSSVAAGFNVLPLPEAVHRLAAGTLPPAAAAITFDDGYADNYEVALPILQRHRLPATVFVASGFLDGGRMWNDTVIEAVRAAPGDVLDLGRDDLGVFPTRTIAERRHAIGALLDKAKYLSAEARRAAVERIAAAAAMPLPDTLMLTSERVRKLAAEGIEIGAHTVSHPILTRLPAAEAQHEIVEGRRALESVLGREVTLFAYPNGKPGVDFADEHVRMAKDAGFAAALTTGWGVSSRTTDPFRLPRFTPWDRTPFKFGVRLARNLLGHP